MAPGFDVLKGWKTSKPGGIPPPVSENFRNTEHLHAPALTLKTPPSGIASTAFLRTLTNACLSSFSLAWIGGRLTATDLRTQIPPASQRIASLWRISSMREFKFTEWK